MSEINPTLIIIFFEALFILALLVLAIPILRYKNNSKTQSAALTLIKRLEKNKSGRTDQLEKIINDSTDIEPEQLNEFLEEIEGSEKIFYQHLLRMFFNRDTELLKKIDKKVQNLSDPYCKLLSHTTSIASNNEALTDELQRAQQEIKQLKQENMAISDQLGTAMETMDEITVEYTQIFGGKRTALELENSSKKMLELFRQSGKRILKTQQPHQLGE